MLLLVAVLALRSERGRLDSAERAWRRFNGACVGLLVLVAVDLLPDLADETELTHRADEAVIAAIAAVAAVWFLSGPARRVQAAIVPLILVAVAELTKLAAVGIEWGDAPDVEGDIVISAIGLPVLLILASWWRRLVTGINPKD